MDNLLYYVGAATCLYLGLQLGDKVGPFLRPSSLPRYLHDGEDSWALVTGASDGIGFALAQELCRRGFNVALHGRNREKLLRVQAQLKTEFPTSETSLVVIDAGASLASIDDVVRDLQKLHLTVLINNVGGNSGLRATYTACSDLTPKEMDLVMDINARFMSHITRVLIPTLARNSPSLIMNLSSAASNGMPYLSIYSASKGYVESFTRALKAEMVAEKKDIEILGIGVGSVQSTGNDVDVGFFIPTSETFAASVLDRVGCGKSLVYTYWPHALQVATFSIIPESIKRKLFVKMIGKLKAEKEEKEKRQK